MTTPYYEADGIRLYLGDCLEVTEWLTADVLITDPPYGLNDVGGESVDTIGSLKYTLMADRPGGWKIKGDEDTSMRDAALDLWGPKRPAILFGSPKVQHPPGVQQVLVWQKPPDTGIFGTYAGFRRDWEAIYLLGNFPKRKGAESSVIRTGLRQPATGHRHSKPIGLMERLCAITTGVIADPFTGAGSTLIAARNLGRPAIGVEYEEVFAEAAAKRLSQLAMIAPATPVEPTDPEVQEALL